MKTDTCKTTGLNPFRLYFLAASMIFLLNIPPVTAQAIQMTPEFQSSRQFLAKGEFDSAIAALQPLVSQSAYAAAAQVEIGNVRLRQGEMEMSKALTHFQEAAQFLSIGLEEGGISGPEMPKTLFDLGKIYEERLSNFDKAAETYERITRDFPTFLAVDKAMYHWGLCLEKLGKIDEAASTFRQIVAEYPYSTFFQAAQEKMVAMAPGTGQAKAAIELQENILEETSSDDQSVKAALDLADMYTESGNYSAAIDTYRNLIKETSDQEVIQDAYKKMATILDEKQKDYKGAAKVLEELIQNYPDDPDYELNLFRLGKIHENDMTAYKTQTNSDGSVRYRKSTENVMKAIEYYDSVTEKFPDADVSADAFLRKGDLYEKSLKDYDEAKQQYQEFLKRFPQHREAEKIRQRLKEIESY